MFDKLVLTCVSAVMGGVACCGVCHVIWQIWKWHEVPAEVVRYWITRSENKPDGQRFFRAVIRFTTVDGRLITTLCAHGHWRKRWPVGTVLNVLYYPRNPRWAKVYCFVEMWGIPLVAFQLALAFGLFAFFCSSD